MKRLSFLAVAFIVTTFYTAAQVTTERCFHLDKFVFLQQKQDFWRSHVLYSTAARPMSMFSGGYFNLTEGTYGWGLAETYAPFSERFAGITMVNGLRIGGGLAVGLGVGYQQYNEGWLLPFYGDVRYYIGRQKNKFFAMASGGMLFNFEDFDDNSRVFFNPGGGITIPLTKSSNLSFAVGYYIQYDVDYFNDKVEGYRDSFINMKLGLLFAK
jgi:hypothetical protein